MIPELLGQHERRQGIVLGARGRHRVGEDSFRAQRAALKGQIQGQAQLLGPHGVSDSGALPRADAAEGVGQRPFGDGERAAD